MKKYIKHPIVDNSHPKLKNTNKYAIFITIDREIKRAYNLSINK